MIYKQLAVPRKEGWCHCLRVAIGSLRPSPLRQEPALGLHPPLASIGKSAVCAAILVLHGGRTQRNLGGDGELEISQKYQLVVGGF